jgi:hypothetical protein
VEKFVRKREASSEFNTLATSAIPVGVKAENFRARVEACMLNTYYARQLLLGSWFSIHGISGKFVLVEGGYMRNKQHILTEAQRTICDDHFIYNAIKKEFGASAVAPLLQVPVYQIMGKKTLRSTMNRFNRWMVIHKRTSPIGYMFEFFMMPALCGFFGATVFAAMVAPYWFFPFYCTHIVLSFLADLWWTIVLAPDETGFDMFFPWLAKELLMPVIWIRAMFSRTVRYRNATYQLGRGCELRFADRPGGLDI